MIIQNYYQDLQDVGHGGSLAKDPRGRDNLQGRSRDAAPTKTKIRVTCPLRGFVDYQSLGALSKLPSAMS